MKAHEKALAKKQLNRNTLEVIVQKCKALARSSLLLWCNLMDLGL
jgi:hypothetical protein